MVRKKVVLNFGSPAESLYQNVFKNVYSRYEFKLLLEKCIQIKEFKIKKSQILKAGNVFDHLVILGKVHPDTKIQLKVEESEEDGVVSNKLESYSWLGTIEYMNLMEGRKEDRNYEQVLNISATVTKITEPLYVFKIDIKSMEKLFTNPTHGMSIQNGMYAKMLDYVGTFVVNMDLEFIEAKKNYFNLEIGSNEDE